MDDVTLPEPPPDTATDAPTPHGASDPWPRTDDPPPRWFEPPDEARKSKPVGPWAALGLVIVTAGGTVAALWAAAMIPTWALRALSFAGIATTGALGAVGSGASVLLMIATAAAIAWWCNRPQRQPIRLLLNIGFGCALLPIAIAAVLFGLCLALLASAPIFETR